MHACVKDTSALPTVRVSTRYHCIPCSNKIRSHCSVCSLTLAIVQSTSQTCCDMILMSKSEVRHCPLRAYIARHHIACACAGEYNPRYNSDSNTPINSPDVILYCDIHTCTPYIVFMITQSTGDTSSHKAPWIHV